MVYYNFFRPLYWENCFSYIILKYLCHREICIQLFESSIELIKIWTKIHPKTKKKRKHSSAKNYQTVFLFFFFKLVMLVTFETLYHGICNSFTGNFTLLFIFLLKNQYMSLLLVTLAHSSVILKMENHSIF